MIIALLNERIVPNIKGLFCEHSQIRLAWEDVLGLCNHDRRPTTATTTHQKGNQWLEQVCRSAPWQAFRRRKKKTQQDAAFITVVEDEEEEEEEGASLAVVVCVLITTKHNQRKSRKVAHLIGSESPDWNQMTGNLAGFIFLCCKCTAVCWKGGY